MHNTPDYPWLMSSSTMASQRQPTGCDVFDHLTGGLAAGEVCVLLAEPWEALDLAIEVCAETIAYGRDVHFLTRVPCRARERIESSAARLYVGNLKYARAFELTPSIDPLHLLGARAMLGLADRHLHLWWGSRIADAPLFEPTPAPALIVIHGWGTVASLGHPATFLGSLRELARRLGTRVVVTWPPRWNRRPFVTLTPRSSAGVCPISAHAHAVVTGSRYDRNMRKLLYGYRPAQPPTRCWVRTDQDMHRSTLLSGEWVRGDSNEWVPL